MADSKKYVSPHLRGLTARDKSPADDKEKKPNVAPGVTEPDSDDGADQPTEGHPVTGVHSIHVKHHSGNRFSSMTEHDGGSMEKRDHADAMDVQQHIDESFPSESRDEGVNDGDDLMASAPPPGGMEMDGL